MENNSILIYQSADGQIAVDTVLQDETVWLTQEQMALLFGKGRSTITEHISNVYAEQELIAITTSRKFRQVRLEGTREVERDIEYYNLDVIISVGYRVKSQQGTQFRIWATQRLKEYLLQGFSLNEEKLKSGKPTEYFDKLQSKLREIRLSERLFYQKVKDIYTTSIDYNPKDEKTADFFAMVQNKLLWAISQKTAAELVYYRVDIALPFLGMQSYDKKEVSKISSADVITAKNYLNDDEMKSLELLVEQYLAFAESMAQSKIVMTMNDWIQKLDMILQMNGREILQGYGKISHKLAEEKVKKVYGIFNQEQKKIEYTKSLKEIVADIKKLRKE
ncbi:MAG: virulence RhuM family protein [Haliscomenobacter sp.]|nr:virulence RhuM family protein [Haliscomenobacter sp.]